MKAGNGKHFEQSHNAQAAVDTDSMLIVGKYITNHGNDKKELVEIVNSVGKKVYTPEAVSAGTGFFSEEAVKAVEREDAQGKRQGTEVFCAVEKQGRRRSSVKDLEKKDEAEMPAAKAPVKEKTAHKLKTPRGKGIYKKRKETVEPVFGIIKSAMGFRQFLLRGLERAGIERDLVTLAYDIKRLFSLSGGRSLPFLPNWG